MEHEDRETFLNLPPAEVAQRLRQRPGGSGVCVFPFNGTRRWFLLEHAQEIANNSAEAYTLLTINGYISTYKLVFDHGLDTIVAPVFGGEIMNRGEEYMREIGASMTLLATHPALLEFYKSYDIRVHFYGDYRKQFGTTPYSYIFDSFD